MLLLVNWKWKLNTREKILPVLLYSWICRGVKWNGSCFTMRKVCSSQCFNHCWFHNALCHLCSRRLEVVGDRENGRAWGRHAMGDACLLLACPFSLVSSTSKLLLRSRLCFMWYGSHFTVGVTLQLLLSSRISLLVINLLTIRERDKGWN